MTLSPRTNDPAPGTVEHIAKATTAYRMGGRVTAFEGLARRTGGTYVEGAQSIDEALAQTGLDFEVRLEAVQATYTDTDIRIIDGEPVEVPIQRIVEAPHKRMTVAHFKDGRPPLAFETVSPSYTPVQPPEALAFGQHIIDGGEGDLVALGAHGKPIGSRLYAAFKLTEGLTVGGQDPYDLFLTIIDSYDKSSGLTALVAPIRIKCTNQTFATFHGRAVPKFSIRHTSGAKDRVAVAREALQLAWTYKDALVEEAEQLLATPMSKDRFLVYAKEVFGDKPVEKQSDRTKTIVRLRDEQLLQLLASETNEFGRGTAYAGYQAIVERVDHFSTVRGRDPEAARQERIVNGQLEALKERAWNLATV